MPTTPVPIPAFTGTLPDPSDRSTYGTRGRAVWAWEVDDAAPGMNALAQAAYDNAVEAADSAVIAAGTSGFRGTWASQTGAANKPYAVYHSSRVWSLLNNLADVTASEPGVSADWADVGGVKRSGDTMTGPLVVPAAATGLQAVPANETVRLLGGAANLPTWTTAGRPASPSDGFFGRNTTLGCLEYWDSTFSAWIQDGWQLGAAVSLSGTATDLTNVIPPWANEVEVCVLSMSTSGTNSTILQLNGETTGYVGAACRHLTAGNTTSALSNGYLIPHVVAAASISGLIKLSRRSGSVWMCSMTLGDLAASVYTCAGSKTLSAALSSLRFTTNSADTFDVGTVTPRWRN